MTIAQGYINTPTHPFWESGTRAHAEIFMTTKELRCTEIRIVWGNTIWFILELLKVILLKSFFIN